MTLNYYSPLRLIRGLAPGMRERGDGHIINVSTWGVLSESTPLFAVYNASKAALTAVSRIIETEWGSDGRALDDAVLPSGPHTDDRTDAGLRRTTGLEGRRGRRLDDHSGALPAGAHRATHGRHRPGRQHDRTRCGQRDDEAATAATQQLTMPKPEIATIADIVRVHAQRRPDAAALVVGDRTITLRRA